MNPNLLLCSRESSVKQSRSVTHWWDTVLWQYQEQREAATPAPACTRAGHLFGLQRRPSRSADEHLPSVAVLPKAALPASHRHHHVQLCWGHGHIHPCSAKTSSEGFLPRYRFGIEKGSHVLQWLFGRYNEYLLNCHSEDNHWSLVFFFKKKKQNKKQNNKNPTKSFKCINYLIFQSIVTFLMSSFFFCLSIVRGIWSNSLGFQLYLKKKLRRLLY